MIVMPSNSTGIRVGYLAHKYEDSVHRLGHLFFPGGQTGPHSFMPYALDNGAFGAFAKGEPFNFGAWRNLMAWARESGQKPMWALCPDSVGNAQQTRKYWTEYSGEVRASGWKVSFAAQDGDTPDDCPADADFIFLGGSTEWKWDSLFAFGQRFGHRLHVGRVNGIRQLMLCQKAGVGSCDGTGFGRTTRQMDELERFLEMRGKTDTQLSLLENFREGQE